MQGSPGVEKLAAQAQAYGKRPAAVERFVDLLAGRSVKSHQFLKNLEALRNPGSVVVLSEITAGLFGGTMSQILKCLTAVKLCEELAQRSILAVPVVLVQADPFLASIRLIDAEGELHIVAIDPAVGIPEGIRGLVLKVREFGRGSFDPGVLALIESAFAPGKTYAAATAELFSELLGPWGTVVVDAAGRELRAISEFTSPCAALPVVAFIADQSVPAMAESLDASGRRPPVPWPGAAVTVGDIRSRRTFRRYNLDLQALYAGEEKVLHRIVKALPHSGLAKLDGLKSEVQACVAGLNSLIPAESSARKSVASCREKIVYQLEKLHIQTESSLRVKEQTASRRIHEACNLLAPGGHRQQQELAGIQIPLGHSAAALLDLYEKMNVVNPESQLIWMD